MSSCYHHFPALEKVDDQVRLSGFCSGGRHCLSPVDAPRPPLNLISAALIVLGDNWTDLRPVGLSWPEFRLREAVAAGAGQIVLLTHRVAPDVVRAVDRLRSEGERVAMVRTAADAAELFHPDDVVLVVGGDAIVGRNEIDRLGRESAPVLFCIGSGPPELGLELIDAQHRWTGFACVLGSRARAVAAEIGEWDFASTLMRDAVRERAVRLVLDASEILLDAGDPNAAARLTAEQVRPDAGWGERFIAAPLGLAAARWGARRLPVIARWASWAIFAVLACSPVVAWLGWISLAFTMLLIASIAGQTLRSAGFATAIKSRSALLVAPALDGAAALTVMAAATTPLDHGPLVLAATLIMMTILLRRSPSVNSRPWTLPDVPGLIVIVGVGSLFGFRGFAIALVAAVAHSFASIMGRSGSGLAAS